MLSKLGRYSRTLRHLRVSQLTGQVMTRLQKKWRDPAGMLAEVPSGWWFPSGGNVELALQPPSLLLKPEALQRGEFTFINQTAELGRPVDWSAPSMPRLWSYNLHYFDWIWALLDEQVESDEDWKWKAAKELAVDWIEHHTPSRTAGGWEPYPISLRLINWSLLFGVRYRETVAADSAFQLQLMDSMARQVKWLELHLETHIQANHLLENLCALYCVGNVLEGAAAERVLRKYTPMLKRELEEQFLGDGMHYERSPMYHLRMLWLLEMLVEVSGQESMINGLASDLLVRGKEALGKMRHPDGKISLFNDAVDGIYLDAWQNVEPSMGAWSLPDAGYYGYRNEAGDYLVVDAGAVGPDYQPGHAHADYLSFELSLGGVRIVTDTGIGTYDTGERRSYDRSTAAHSTVEIAGVNSAEVWGGFRVGRRVVPKVKSWNSAEKRELVVEHTGYAHLSSCCVHQRQFSWSDTGVEIADQVTAKAEDVAVSRIHLAPECDVSLDGSEVTLRCGGQDVKITTDGGELSIEEHPCCFEFGVSQQRKVLVMKHHISAGVNQWKVRIEKI